MAKTKKCRACGTEMAASAKICPQCGAKNKKPLYKRWWVYVLAVIVFFLAIPGGNSSGGSGEQAVPKTAETAANQGNGPEQAVPKTETVPKTEAGTTKQNGNSEQAATKTDNATTGQSEPQHDNQSIEDEAEIPSDFDRAYCAPIDGPDAIYKDLLRYPEEYKGQYVCDAVQIIQVMMAGKVKRYTCYAVEWNEFGMMQEIDEEYFIYDYRGEDAVKLIENDVIEVYGKYVGPEEITFAISGTTSEIVAIHMYDYDMED